MSIVKFGFVVALTIAGYLFYQSQPVSAISQNTRLEIVYSIPMYHEAKDRVIQGFIIKEKASGQEFIAVEGCGVAPLNYK